MLRRFIFVSILAITACKPSTPEGQIRQTSQKILELIRKGDAEGFAQQIGVKLRTIGKDERIIKADIQECRSYLDKYLGEKEPDIVLTNEYHSTLGYRKVVIPIYKGKDSSRAIATVDLELYFGPPEFVPLDKISGYKLLVARLPGGFQAIPSAPIRPTNK